MAAPMTRMCRSWTSSRDVASVVGPADEVQASVDAEGDASGPVDAVGAGAIVGHSAWRRPQKRHSGACCTVGHTGPLTAVASGTGAGPHLVDVGGDAQPRAGGADPASPRSQVGESRIGMIACSSIRFNTSRTGLLPGGQSSCSAVPLSAACRAERAS